MRETVGCTIIGIMRLKINNKMCTIDANVHRINHFATDKYFHQRWPPKTGAAIGHGYRPVIYHRLNGRNAPLLLERAVR